MSEKELNIVSYVSLGVIVCAFIICYRYIKNQDDKGTAATRRGWMEEIPSLISTLGVLGTFFGITIGLVFFDTENLESSIPLLLAGLKTAFFTSLAGMIGSMILTKRVNAIFDKLGNGMSDIQTAAASVCSAISKLQQEIQAQQKAVSTFQAQMTKNLDAIALSTTSSQQSLDNISHAIMHTSDTIDDASQKLSEVSASVSAIPDIKYSVEPGPYLQALNTISQGISHADEQNADKIERLIGQGDTVNSMLELKFQEFSELLKKSNTEALVEVMKRVTEEFERQMSALINKLVQENFDQLNTSVKQLNKWQMENKEMIVSLTDKYRAMEKSFGDTSKALEKVTSNTGILVSNDGKLGRIVAALNEVMVNDKKFIEITSNLTKAAEFTKDNVEQFDGATSKLNEWVRKHQNLVEAVGVLISKLDELGKIRNYSEQFWSDTKKSLEEGIGFIANGSRTLNSQLAALDKSFYERLGQTLAELDACIQAMIKKK